MASITIRNLDDKLKEHLRMRAAKHGRSMEDEARDILRVALAADRAAPQDLGLAIRRRLAPFGGVELPTARREWVRDPPNLDP
ncbi:MAG: FitA-like ribbon-helix-helix domain-containing protein [Geminicoccaceae bacterium]